MADWVAVAAAVVLGAVFLVAGASKIAAGPDWTVQAKGLGAPTVTIPVVPWVEIALGGLLVAQVQRPLASLAALALLVVFTVLIGTQLAKGRRPPCACFGAWSAKPLGAGHLARNVGLMVLGVLALF